MALNDAVLKAGLKLAITNAKAAGVLPGANAEAIEEAYLDQTVAAIKAYILTAAVNPGIVVAVVPATGLGATTGPGTLS